MWITKYGSYFIKLVILIIGASFGISGLFQRDGLLVLYELMYAYLKFNYFCSSQVKGVIFAFVNNVFHVLLL